MKELFALFAQIAMSRKGPQDLPASWLLLVADGLRLLRSCATSSPGDCRPGEHWQLHLLVEIVFTLAWYAVLLRAVGKPERFMQTATAIFGSQPAAVSAVDRRRALLAGAA